MKYFLTRVRVPAMIPFFIFLTYSILSQSVHVIITFEGRLWQQEIRELLTKNSTCSSNDVDFVWRQNPGAVSLPTDFGVVRFTFTSTLSVFESYKECIHREIPSVRRIDIDSLPDTRNMQSTGLFGGSETDNQGEIKSNSKSGRFDGHFRVIRPFKDNEIKNNGRNLLYKAPDKFIPASIATPLHSRGYYGQGVNVAIFDSGMVDPHPHFKHVRERTDWTTDKTIDDNVGHGSFVAGVVAGTSPECPGIAPESNLFIFRVFSTSQQSYTSWFLDAFNYALFLEIDVINFSIGGPDSKDSPFTDKINELSANGIIVISAVGNDGPLWGSILNPADQSDVLSVGGWGNNNDIASFSSRGMTTAEIPLGGMGRVKPDLLAPSISVYSSDAKNPFKCHVLSGTSVATPVVTGVVAALLSQAFDPYIPTNETTTQDEIGRGSESGNFNETINKNDNGSLSEIGKSDSFRGTYLNSTESLHNISTKTEIVYNKKSPKFLHYHNIAAIKQVIMASARPLSPLGIFEQGSGVLNVESALSAWDSHRSSATLHPSRVTNLPEDCPYLWPWCMTSIYRTSQPLLVNFTILNSMGVYGRITEIKWIETNIKKSNDVNNNGNNGRNNATNDNKIDHKNRNDENDEENSVSWSKVSFSAANSVGTFSSSWDTQNATKSDSDFKGIKNNVNHDKNSSKKGKKHGNSDQSDVLILTGKYLTLRIQLSRIIYPYSGYLAVAISVTDKTNNNDNSKNINQTDDKNKNRIKNENKNPESENVEFYGDISGKLIVTVETPGQPLFTPVEVPKKEKKRLLSESTNIETSSQKNPNQNKNVKNERNVQISVASAEVIVRVQSTPPREKRILWDVYHHITYPSAHVLRDDLSKSSNSFDWLGDHPYTNYRNVYMWLLKRGYFVELLRGPWTCFDSKNYKMILIIDAEEIFGTVEIEKLVRDVRVDNLSVLLISEWYDDLIIQSEKYHDENTHSKWYPITGGSNIPSINSFLSHFSASIGLQSFKGTFRIKGEEVGFLSGNTLSLWPQGGIILKTKSKDLEPHEKTNLRADSVTAHAVAGFMEIEKTISSSISTSTSSSTSSSSTTVTDPTSISPEQREKARIVVFTDSSCFEVENISQKGCEKLINLFFDYMDSGSAIPEFNSLKSATSNSNINSLNSTSDSDSDSNISGSGSNGSSDISNSSNSSSNITGITSIFDLDADYEILTHSAFSQPNLMELSRVLSASELAVLKKEKKARAWEFSRSSKVSDHNGHDKISFDTNLCYAIL